MLVTLGLVIDGFRKSREQRDRWDREDKVRADAAQPKAVVEPAKRENYPHVIALCYNLGERPFVIDKLIISVRNGAKTQLTQTSDLLGPHVVQVGAFVPVPVDCTELLKGKTGLQYATITLRLKGSAGIVDTEPVWFNFYPDEANGYEWGVGGPHDRSPGMLVQHPRVIPDDGLHR